MEYFPHLYLGHLSIRITLVSFAVFFIITVTSLTISKWKYKWNLTWMDIVWLSFIGSILVEITFDVTIRHKIFQILHFNFYNKHLPVYSKCISYKPHFSVLNAEFEISHKNLMEWVKKYKLEEEPPNTFKSKVAENGQGLIAQYFLDKKKLVIYYAAF